MLGSKILIGIPAYNEVEHIEWVVRRAKKYGDVLVVDDGSEDGTRDVAFGFGVHVITSPHHGYGHALKEIFSFARRKGFDVLITLDGDGQHDPDEIPRFLSALDGHDIVLGNRFKDASKTPVLRKVVIGVLGEMYDVGDPQCGFRAYNRKAIESIYIKDEGMGASLEILNHAGDRGLRMTEVPCRVSYSDTRHSQSSVSHGLSLVETILWMTIWKRPLLCLGLPGMILLSIGMFSMYVTLTFYSATRIFIQSWLTGTIMGLLSGILLTTTSLIIWAIRRAVKEISD